MVKLPLFTQRRIAIFSVLLGCVQSITLCDFSVQAYAADDGFPIEELGKAPEPEEEPTRITPEIIKAIAEEAKLPHNSPHFKRFLEAAQEGSLRNEEDVEVRPIIKHLRSDQGIPFPSKDEVKPIIKLSAEQRREATTKYLEIMNKMKKMQEHVPELPRCLENRTTKVASGYKTGQEDSKEVLFDMLFIRRGDLPMDTSDVFGKRTIVRPYYTDTPNSPSLSALGAGVKCLPFRFRATKSFGFTDEGTNALKNYDKNPYGAGILHDRMKAIVGGR